LGGGYEFKCEDEWNSQKGQILAVYPADAKDPSLSKYPLVVFGHGRDAQPQKEYLYTLHSVAAHGFIILAPDSASAVSQSWCEDFYKDLLATLMWAKDTNEGVLKAIDWDAELLFYGHSMGGNAALRASNHEHGAPFLQEYGHSSLADRLLRSGVLSLDGFFSHQWAPQDADRDEQIVLYITGHADYVATPGVAEWLYEQDVSNEKTFLDVTGETHTSVVTDKKIIHAVTAPFLQCAATRQPLSCMQLECNRLKSKIPITECRQSRSTCLFGGYVQCLETSLLSKIR